MSPGKSHGLCLEKAAGLTLMLRSQVYLRAKFWVSGLGDSIEVLCVYIYIYTHTPQNDLFRYHIVDVDVDLDADVDVDVDVCITCQRR